MASRGLSSVWNSFVKVEDGRKVRCKLCDARLKFNGSTMSSMREHLVRKHPSAPAAAASIEKKKSEVQGSTTMSQFLGKQVISEKRKALITSCLAEWLTDSLRIASIVADDGLVELFRLLEPAYRVPSRTNMMAIIGRQYELLRKELIVVLDQVDGIAITTDTWSSSRSMPYSTLLRVLSKHF